MPDTAQGQSYTFPFTSIIQIYTYSCTLCSIDTIVTRVALKKNQKHVLIMLRTVIHDIFDFIKF